MLFYVFIGWIETFFSPQKKTKNFADPILIIESSIWCVWDENLEGKTKNVSYVRVFCLIWHVNHFDNETNKPSNCFWMLFLVNLMSTFDGRLWKVKRLHLEGKWKVKEGGGRWNLRFLWYEIRTSLPEFTMTEGILRLLCSYKILWFWSSKNTQKAWIFKYKKTLKNSVNSCQLTVMRSQ